MIQRYLILIVCALAHLSAYAEGFLAGTLVKTPFGYENIENLTVGDKVVCYDFMGKCVTRTVTHVQQEEVDTYAQITIGNEQVFAALDHKFYVPNDNAWLEANKIKPGSVLLKRCTEYIPVDSVEVIEAPTVVYDITVDELHNFCVTREDVCVHNILPIIAGIGITIGFDGAVAFTASLAAFGVTLIGGTLWSNSREKQQHRIKVNLKSHVISIIQLQKTATTSILLIITFKAGGVKVRRLKMALRLYIIL
jgi:hypothetical protein